MVNVQTIHGSGASRTSVGSNVSTASPVNAGISDPRAIISSLGNDKHAGYSNGDNDGLKLHRKRSKGTAKLALKLKKSLRDLIFQNAKVYIDYYKKSHGFEAEYKFDENTHHTETYNDSLMIDKYHTDKFNGMDHEYYSHQSHDEEDPPFASAGDNIHKKKNKHNKHRNAPSIQMGTNTGILWWIVNVFGI